MLILYHLVMFSRFNLNDDLKFFMGYTYALSIIIMAAVNIILMVLKAIAICKSKKRKAANYKVWLKKMQEEQDLKIA